jgi:hypothetical protein
MAHTCLLAPAIVISAALLAGCAIHDPYQRLAAPPTTVPTTAGAPLSPERDGPANQPTLLLAGGAASSPRAALARFATLYTNWTAAQLPERAAQLAAISVGQAHAQALALAARAPTLHRYQVANTGTVAAIAPGEGQESGRWAVITNELTTGTGPYLGLSATSHVTWATLTHQPAGYVIATWYPAS